MSSANSLDLRSGPDLRSKQFSYLTKLVQISANGTQRVKYNDVMNSGALIILRHQFVKKI